MPESLAKSVIINIVSCDYQGLGNRETIIQSLLALLFLFLLLFSFRKIEAILRSGLTMQPCFCFSLSSAGATDVRCYTQLNSHVTCLFLQGTCWSARPERGVTPGSCTLLLMYRRHCNRACHKRAANSGVPRGKGLEFSTILRNLNKVKLEAQQSMLQGRSNTQESGEGRAD